MSFSNYIIIEDTPHACVIKFNRPDKLNALDADMFKALNHAIDHVESRLEKESVAVCVLTGQGKAFVAGADISAMHMFGPEEALAFALEGQRTFRRLEKLPIPCIAAVNGFALGGGCELALACDFIIASEKAKLGQPETKLGVIPGFAGTQRLMRRVGIARAKQLCFTGEMLNATEALNMGLINEVCQHDELMTRVVSIVKLIHANGPHAVAACKDVIDKGQDLPFDEASQIEAHAFAKAFATNEQKEGMQAFLSKRAAEFRG